MELSKGYIRGLLLYDFKFGESAAASCRHIGGAFGEGTVSDRTAREWFARLRKGAFILQDPFRSGRKSDVNNDRLRQLVESDPTPELTQDLGVHYATIARHLHQLGNPLLGISDREFDIMLSQKHCFPK
ncbi:unnamed protein product [Heligmosomoides polygyrus]|uniref:HTH_48 domain-containing protein n=1 Tax=Heligmosomoides polygyrus TaxID=6339 RepID=A0A183GB53_HELPZ|nr:unnamed protein product [Heligmosomoides polygyrus]